MFNKKMSVTSTSADTGTTPVPMDTSPVPATAPVKVKREPNQWIKHVNKWRKDNADKIKDDKMSCGEISKMARETYTPRPKCKTCGR